MANTHIVPTVPDLLLLNSNGVRATYPVVGSTHRNTAAAVNWLLGRGHNLVVDGPKIIPQAAGGAAPQIFSYFYHRDAYHYSLNLQITMSSLSAVGANTPCYGRIQFPTGGPDQTFGVDRTPTTFNMRLDLGSATNATEEISFRLYNDAPVGDGITNVTILVHQILIYECPNPTIEPAGLNYFTFAPKSPIYFDAVPIGASISQLASLAQIAAHTIFRRGALFTVASPEINTKASPGGGGSSSYTQLFRMNPSIQAPMMGPGSTKKTCKCAVKGALQGTATSVDVRITMTTGDVATCNSAAGAWSSVQDIDIERDDPARWATDGGIRGGTRDVATIEYRANGTAGAGAVLVSSVCIWDEPE